MTNTLHDSLDVKQIVWIFIVCCFIGCLLESLFASLAFGQWQTRRGLIFGPFTPIYGGGAILMCFTAIPASKVSWLLTFIVGAVTGGAVELLSSYIEELSYGARSWDFSNLPFSIAGGRTSLLFMFLWGVLSCVFAKWIYPLFLHLYNHIPPLQNTALCILVIILFVADMTFSSMAITRWQARMDGAPATQLIDSFFDNHFTDDVMNKIYPNYRKTE